MVSGSGKSESFSDSEQASAAKGTFRERYARILSAVGATTDAGLAKALGIKSQSLAGSKKKGKIPPLWIEVIAEKYGVSADWLLFGEGPVRRGDVLSQVHSLSCVCEKEGRGRLECQESPSSAYPSMQEKARSHTEDAPSSSHAAKIGIYEFFPLVGARLGPEGRLLQEKGGGAASYAFQRDWIADVASSGQRLVMMRMAGDSMEPDIQDGGMVMIDLGRRSPKDGCVFVLRFDENLVIKELELLPGGMCRVISRNQNRYAPYTSPLKDLCIVGQVIWGDRTFPR
jgi:hypothetical protein